MNISDLMPRTKVTAYFLGGSITVAVFWILIEIEILEDWPEAWVLAAFAIIIGFIAAWIIPDPVWERAREHLQGTVRSDTGQEAEVEGDVTLTPTGEGKADIEGEVDVDPDTGEIFVDEDSTQD